MTNDTNDNKRKNYSDRLRNYSEPSSFDRLSDEDFETASSLIAGGDAAYLFEDINDEVYLTDEEEYRD